MFTKDQVAYIVTHYFEANCFTPVEDTEMKIRMFNDLIQNAHGFARLSFDFVPENQRTNYYIQVVVKPSWYTILMSDCLKRKYETVDDVISSIWEMEDRAQTIREKNWKRNPIGSAIFRLLQLSHARKTQNEFHTGGQRTGYELAVYDLVDEYESDLLDVYGEIYMDCEKDDLLNRFSRQFSYCNIDRIDKRYPKLCEIEKELFELIYSR